VTENDDVTFKCESIDDRRLCDIDLNYVNGVVFVWFLKLHFYTCKLSKLLFTSGLDG